MFSKLDESPKITLTPLAQRAETSDASLPVPELCRIRPSSPCGAPRPRPPRRLLLQKLLTMRLQNYESLRTSHYELHHAFPGIAAGPVACALRNPRCLRQLQGPPRSSVQIPVLGPEWLAQHQITEEMAEMRRVKERTLEPDASLAEMQGHVQCAALDAAETSDLQQRREQCTPQQANGRKAVHFCNSPVQLTAQNQKSEDLQHGRSDGYETHEISKSSSTYENGKQNATRSESGAVFCSSSSSDASETPSFQNSAGTVDFSDSSKHCALQCQKIDFLTNPADAPTSTLELDFRRLFPAPDAPKTLFSNFVHSGDAVLKRVGRDFAPTFYGDSTDCRDIAHPSKPFEATLGRDRFVRAAVEFTKAANYVYQNRYNPNLDIMRISARVARLAAPEITEEQFADLLNITLVSLTTLQLRK